MGINLFCARRENSNVIRSIQKLSIVMCKKSAVVLEKKRREKEKGGIFFCFI